MIKVTLEKNIDPSILSGRATKLETVMTQQIIKDTRPFVPAMTMSLNQRTHAVGNTIVYPGPYARYLYYGHRMVDSLTGKGPMYIPDVGYRWHKGAHLVPTEEPLHYSTAVHKDAQARWMEASRRRNWWKWERIAKRVYTDGR